MPIYEFECNKCGERFDLVERLSEHEKHEEKCPKCGSKEVKQILGTVSVHTSKKS